jgi:hypothetical protein
VVGLIESVCSHYWYNHGLIHERTFNEPNHSVGIIEINFAILRIDTLPERIGKHLNELATNRQRFMMDNHEFWLAELDKRKETERLAAEEKEIRRAEREARQVAKPLKCRDCSDHTCRSMM